MTLHDVTQRIHDHLRDPATRQRLSNRFIAAREQLTTSIGEAAKLAGVPAEKARYAETIGILTPSRSRQGVDGAHRRYSLGELNRLIIMGELIDHGFSISEIGRYLNRDRNATDMLSDTIQAADLATRQRQAERAHLQRMIIPRLMYFAQCLLLGDVLDCSIALVLPVEKEPGSTQSHSPITSVDDLPLVGPSLVGWHARNHPYCVLYTSEPRMDGATRYAFRSIDEMCRESGVADIDAQPTGAYLLIDSAFEHLLYAPPAGRIFTAPEPPRGEPEKKRTNPRAVAYRLLKMLRQPADETNHTFGHNYSSIGDGMIYSSPEFVRGMVGDPLLTEIADLLVRLGNDATVSPLPGRGQWVFAAILLPDDRDLLPGQQSLVVYAQSEQSPHVPGVTRLTLGENEGLSTIAALARHLFIRPALESDDPAAGDIGFEGEPGPALALPIVSMYGRVLAVLYVRSRYADGTTEIATFTLDDQLLLRVFGHIIGSLVFMYHGSELTRDALVGMIDRPRVVDRLMQEFQTANSFWSHLKDALIAQTAGAPSPQQTRAGASRPQAHATSPITLLAVDIDRYADIVYAHGTNTARHLVREVGRRIPGKPLLISSPLMEASNRSSVKLYHMYGDRFILLLENISQDAAFSYARSLRGLLTGDYTLNISRTIGGQTIPVATTEVKEVKVRIAVISYDHQTLRRMLASPLTDEPTPPGRSHDPVQHAISVMTSALTTGLNQGKQKGGAIMYLDMELGVFRELPESAGSASGRGGY